MQRRLKHTDLLLSLLQPETALERELLNNSEFCRGLQWGEPRFGHPEGVVAFHVQEVLANIDKISQLNAADRTKLRIIAFSHDAFKYAENRTKPRDKNKHHGILARHFMETFIQDETVLRIIELHDEAYYCWLSRQKKPNQNPFNDLTQVMGPDIQLYYQFFKCDTQTGDKTQAPLRFFEALVPNIQVHKIKPYWPWEKI